MKNIEPKKPKQEPMPPAVEIPQDAQEETRVESRFVSIGKLDKVKEKRLRDLYFIWCNPLSGEGKKQSLRLDEIKELREAGIIKDVHQETTDAGPDLADVDVCDSIDELARRMMLHFQNPDKSSKLAIEITKRTISDWKAHRGLASTIPPFPTIKGGRTRYSLRAAIEWFNNHLWHVHRANLDQTNGSASPFVPIGELRLVAERAELEKTLFDIEVAKGGYLATTKTEAILGGTMRQYHDFVKGLLENVSPELFESFWQSIGLTPEQITASKDFQVKEYRRIIDEIEIEAERRSNENADRIETQVKHDLGQ